MAGSTGAGYAHFNKLSGINGLYTGAAGSEIRQDNKNFVVTFSFGNASAAEIKMAILPYGGTLTNVYSAAINSAQSSTTTVLLGSAGTTLATATWASPGTIGTAQTSSVTVATSTGTAGIQIAASRAATGTTGESVVTLVFDRTTS